MCSTTRTALSLLVLLVLVQTISVSTQGIINDTDAAWDAFKAKFKKIYNNSEDVLRKAQWLKNLYLIHQHNMEGLATYTLTANSLSDWFENEYKKLLGFIFPPNNIPNPSSGGGGGSGSNQYTNTIPASQLPASVNWTARGWVNPVQNQGQCGDCWAFAACGAMEGQYFNATKTSAVLSEQNLCDCTNNKQYGNLGCNGGSVDVAFQYVINNRGIERSASYPYTASNGQCSYSSAKSAGYITTYTDIQSGNEIALQQASALIGPIAVGIDASHTSFQLYNSGVYSSVLCSSTKLDHAVLVVGYGTTTGGQDYWLIKNSWGTKWGIYGYMMMARNSNNMCGIATAASFPLNFQTTGTQNQGVAPGGPSPKGNANSGAASLAERYMMLCYLTMAMSLAAFA